jgi:hypothetical protein
MDTATELWEVPTADGRRLWLGAGVDWTFGADGADYHLPLFMWMVGVREDEDHLLLDRDEPFISVAQALELAPAHADDIVRCCQALVDRTRRNITLLGFGPSHPYRDEIRRFVAATSRARRGLAAGGAVDVEVTGQVAPARRRQGTPAS